MRQKCVLWSANGVTRSVGLKLSKFRTTVWHASLQRFCGKRKSWVLKTMEYSKNGKKGYEQSQTGVGRCRCAVWRNFNCKPGAFDTKIEWNERRWVTNKQPAKLNHFCIIRMTLPAKVKSKFDFDLIMKLFNCSLVSKMAIVDCSLCTVEEESEREREREKGTD